jgi:hypothetical protein
MLKNLYWINFSVVLIFFMACAVNKPNRTCHTIGLYRYCSNNTAMVPRAAIDGDAGLIKSPTMVINYDHATAAYPGPQSAVDYFMQTFRSMHYMKYFDSIHIDKKVQKLFRDSVRLISLQEIPIGSAKCKACNYEAQLQFRQFKTPFYYFVTDDLKKEWAATQFQLDTIHDFAIKFYRNTKEMGAYIKEKKGTRQSKKLSLVLESGDYGIFVANVKASL